MKRRMKPLRLGARYGAQVLVVGAIGVGGFSGLTAAAVGPGTEASTSTRPDLVVRSLSLGPYSVVAGGRLTVKTIIRNEGRASARPSTMSLHLSRDRRLGRGDIHLTAKARVAQLKARRKRSASATATVPPSAPRGLFHVLACADAGRKLNEAKEKNNCTASKRRVRVRGTQPLTPQPLLPARPIPTSPPGHPTPAESIPVPIGTPPPAPEEELQDPPSPGTLGISGASPTTFNPLTAEVGFDLSGATFGDGAEEVSVFNNGELVPSPSLTLRPGAVSLGTVLGDGRNELELAAPDSDGLLLYGDAVVWAGSNTLEVTVRREGTPAPGVSVTSSLGDDQQVSATKITDPSGIATFENLPDRTIILEATDSENRHGALATTGVAGAVTLDIAGIAPAAATENKDFSCACADGWDGTAPVTVVPHQEGSSPASLGAAAESTVQARPVRSRVRADTSRAQPAAPGEDNDLSISTAGEGPASRSHSFEVDPGTTEISVRYRFVTSEVPGGWCGTKYNDYFNVAIRSKNAGGSISEGDSMNGLGCGAFDASGATAWREASLPVKPVNETTGDTVQVDVTVANVGDDLLDSSVIVDFVEEKTFTIEQLDLNDVDNKDLTHFSTFPAPPDYFGGHANVHGTVRIKGKEDDGVETLELEVVEGGGPVATAELASGAEGALLQDFGDDEKVEVTASQLLFRLAAGEAAGIESSENGTVTLRAKAKSKKGEEDTKEFQAPLPKLTRYVNPNRYGGRDPSEGGDDWVKPSVRTVAEALGGNTYGDFSSMHGGDKCAFGAPPSCTTHKEHKTGNDIDGIFDGYYAPDPTQLANDSCALRGLASPCPKRKVTVAAASTILGWLNGTYGTRIVRVLVTYCKPGATQSCAWDSSQAFWNAIKDQTVPAPGGGTRAAGDVIRPMPSHHHHFHIDISDG
jgi:hypothetical protein